MSRIGILAYGSLIEDPGIEIGPLISERRENIETPFSVEFARSSTTRDDAPTIVPVESGGSPVSATILVLNEGVSLSRAEDLLWRRETRNESSDRHYTRPSDPGPNRMVVERLDNFGGLSTVLFTKLGANIDDLSAAKLARRAISSAKGKAGKTGKDGISYLISVMRQGIETPLMPDYEKEILEQTGASCLEDALFQCRNGSA